MEHRVVAQFEANSTVLLARLQRVLTQTLRLNIQQSIPTAATCAAGGGYTEARAPPHELLNDDTVRAVPDVVDFNPFGEVILTNDTRPLRAVYDPNAITETSSAANTCTISVACSKLHTHAASTILGRPSLTPTPSISRHHLRALYQRPKPPVRNEALGA
jgi:hypothetical protein